MAANTDLITLVNVLKSVVDFVSDDTKVQKFYDDVGGIQKVSDDLQATTDKYTATMRALNDMKDLEISNAAASVALAQREQAVQDLEANVELDRRRVAADRATLDAAIKAAQTDAAAAAKARADAEADKDEAARLLENEQAKSDALDKAITDYKTKLAKLSDV